MTTPLQRLKTLQADLDEIERQMNDSTLSHSDQQMLDQAWDDIMAEIDDLEDSQRVVTIAPPPPPVTAPGTHMVPLPIRSSKPAVRAEEEDDDDDRMDCRYCAGCAYCEDSGAYDHSDEI